MGDTEEKFLAQFGSELYFPAQKEMVKSEILTGKKVLLYFSGKQYDWIYIDHAVIYGLVTVPVPKSGAHSFGWSLLLVFSWLVAFQASVNPSFC